MNTNSDTSSHIPIAGVLFLVMLSFLWGTNMVSIRISSQGVPPIMAATIRSVIASFLLWIYARYLSEKVFLYEVKGDGSYQRTNQVASGIFSLNRVLISISANHFAAV